MIQVPTSITKIFEFGKIFVAPTAKASLSFPKVFGVLYKILIGRGVNSFNKIQFLFESKELKFELFFTVESINLSHLGNNFITKSKSKFLSFETNVSSSN